MNLADILQVLEHLNDIEIIGYGDHFVFQNKATVFHTQNICRPAFFLVCLYILSLVFSVGQGRRCFYDVVLYFLILTIKVVCICHIILSMKDLGQTKKL